MDFIPELLTALLGGGIVALFTIPEKKASARLDNAERLVKKYEEILVRYEKRISELENEVEELREKLDKKDSRILALETKLSAMEQRRDARGRFRKSGTTTDESK